MTKTVLQALNDGVLLLTLNRPEKKNAFNTEQWVDLADALNNARDNDDVLVVVLTGAGGDFSAGQDLAGRAVEEGIPEDYKITENAIKAFDKPLIAAAKGIAVGGGATILGHCDIVYVGESLRLREPFSALGLTPEFASSYLLQTQVGTQRAADLMFTSAWVSAAEAVDFGLALNQFKDEELLQKALDKANEIAQFSLGSLREIKRCLLATRRENIETALKVEHAAMATQSGSPENIEAITAFMQKRKPDFKKLKDKK